MSAIFLPADQYLHRDAPTEWWWHVGTLKAGARIFGFEISATAYSDRGIAFSQIMLSDVANKKHYQRTALYVPPVAVNVASWAEHDVTKDWHVGLGSISNCLTAIDVVNPGSGYSSDPMIEIAGGGGSQAVAYATLSGGKVVGIQVTNPGRGYASTPTVSISGGGGKQAAAKAAQSYVTMDSAWGDPTKNMAVLALLIDEATGTKIQFDLMMSQEGSPFLVWGTGVIPILPPASGTHLQINNYYYSLTRIDTTGTITIDGEKFAVTGRTWMDHEYGYFGTATRPVKWVFQPIQLDNGWSISNYTTFNADPPKLNQKAASTATLQSPDDAMYVVSAFLTPIGRTWKSPASGITYFMEFQIEVPSFQATFKVSSLVDAQEFATINSAVYEGVAAASGTFLGKPVFGTAWNEQALPNAE